MVNTECLYCGFEKHFRINSVQTGGSGNSNGRPQGARNRSTIARRVLEMRALYSETDFTELKALYPDLEKSMTVEEMITIIQADKAIRNKDTAAYRAIMDSAYGAPKQEMDHVGNMGIVWEEIKSYVTFE